MTARRSSPEYQDTAVDVGKRPSTGRRSNAEYGQAVIEVCQGGPMVLGEVEYQLAKRGHRVPGLLPLLRELERQGHVISQTVGDDRTTWFARRPR